MQRVAVVAVLAMAGLVACSSESDQVRARPEPEESAPPVTSGTPTTTDEQLEFGAQARSYQVYQPASLPTNTPIPVVLVLHGGLGTGAGAAQQGKWNAHAELGAFLAVFPNGIDRTWNAGICCPPAARNQVDDVGFLLAVLDQVATEFDVDPDRVYATGISNGGMMAYRLGCEAGERFAAIAPVAATVTSLGCAPASPVSLLHIHGLADQNVPFDGGLPTKSFNPNPPTYEPVRAGVGAFLDADGCAGDPEETEAGKVVTETWSVCEAGSAVELITIADGGHSWPSGRRLSPALDPPSDALDATPLIWDFFGAHPKQRL
ncbi:MAG: alpha/beta hydrolase family esterase [Actinomycetota bacterium]